MALLQANVIYKGHIIKVGKNTCDVYIPGTMSQLKDIPLCFPMYGVEYFEDSKYQYGHGIIYSPEIGSHCLVTLIEGDPYVLTFIPPYDQVRNEPMIQNVDDIDQSIDGLAAVKSQLESRMIELDKKAKAQNLSNRPSYHYGDEDLTLGDVGFTTASGNKILATSYGLNVVAASNYCFRTYSKLENTIREGFRNFIRFTPSGDESWTNQRDRDTDEIKTLYIKRLKYSYEDQDPIYTFAVGQQVDGYYKQHASHHTEDSGSYIEVVDLGANVARIYEAGSDVCTESIGRNEDGRTITARNHSIGAKIDLSLTASLMASLSGKLTVLTDGVENSVQGVQTTVKGKAMVHINPPQEKKSENSSPTGGEAQKAGGMKAADLLGKVKDYAPQINKTVSQLRAGKVKEAMTQAAITYGPKLIDKVGGVPPAAGNVKTKALDKVSGAVDRIASKLPEGMKDQVKDAVTKKIEKYATQQFENLVSNGIARASGNIIDAQTTESVMGAVCSSGPETYDRDDVEFKEDDMDKLSEDHIGPKTKDVVKSASEDPSPDDPSVTVLEDQIADDIVSDIVREQSNPRRNGRELSTFASRGM